MTSRRFDCLLRKEFQKEIAEEQSIRRHSWDWELEIHRGLWNYWREEDRFCEEMNRRFPVEGR